MARLLAALAIYAGAMIVAVSTARAETLLPLVDRAAHTAGVPVSIARAVIRIESNFDPTVRGRAGEWGLAQIKCQTARGEGFRGRCSALADPQVNLTYGMRYLRRALDRGGSGCAGVSLYQRGIGSRVSCSAYGRRVMAAAGR